MKSIIFLFVLIACALCETKKNPRIQISDIYKTFKTKIYKCILETEGVSAQLKELASKNLDSDETQLINFESISLSLEDRHIIRECKKKAFMKSNNDNSNHENNNKSFNNICNCIYLNDNYNPKKKFSEISPIRIIKGEEKNDLYDNFKLQNEINENDNLMNVSRIKEFYQSD